MSKYTESVTRTVPTVDVPYRKGLAVADKSIIAANSTLWRSPLTHGKQEGAVSAKIFSNVELGAATDVRLRPLLRRMQKDALNDPVAFLVSLNAEVAFSDHTALVVDDNLVTHAPLDALDTLANGDAFFVGYSEFPVGVSLEIHGTNNNGNASVLSAHYETAPATYSALTIKDFTKEAGATLAHDGEVLWEVPSDAVKTTKNGILAYWVRFTVSGALSATVDVQECGVLTGYAFVAQLSLITKTADGRFGDKVDIDGDDVAVLLSVITGDMGDSLVDIDLGFN